VKIQVVDAVFHSEIPLNFAIFTVCFGIIRVEGLINIQRKTEFKSALNAENMDNCDFTENN
jgi:hypothetical protein